MACSAHGELLREFPPTALSRGSDLLLQAPRCRFSTNSNQGLYGRVRPWGELFRKSTITRIAERLGPFLCCHLDRVCRHFVMKTCGRPSFVNCMELGLQVHWWMDGI